MWVRVEHTVIDGEFGRIRIESLKPAMHTDKDKLTDGVTLAYKEREEVGELDNEWFQLFGGRSFPTQHPLSSLSSGKFNLLSVHVVLLCLHFLTCIFNIPFCLNLGYF